MDLWHSFQITDGVVFRQRGQIASTSPIMNDKTAIMKRKATKNMKELSMTTKEATDPIYSWFGGISSLVIACQSIVLAW